MMFPVQIVSYVAGRHFRPATSLTYIREPRARRPFPASPFWRAILAVKGSFAASNNDAPLTAYSRSTNEIMDTREEVVWEAPVRSVNIRAFHRSKHLVVLLFKRASRCYEYLTATVDVFPESSERRDAFGS
jgi:hypothetical protein